MRVNNRLNKDLLETIDHNMFDGCIFARNELYLCRFFENYEGAAYARQIMANEMLDMCQQAHATHIDGYTVTRKINGHDVKLLYFPTEHTERRAGHRALSVFSVDDGLYADAIGAAAAIIGGWNYKEAE